MLESIKTLKSRGWSNRRIAKELGIHRQPVAKLLTVKTTLELHHSLVVGSQRLMATRPLSIILF